jgi:hypothetical protein
MASSSQPRIVALLAGAAITKGMAVKKGTDDSHVVKGAANTDKIIGFAQNTVTTAEDVVEVALPGGGGKVLLGEACVMGNHLVSHTDGTAVKVNASGDVIGALAMKDGSSGDLIDCEIINCLGVAAE